MQRSPWWRQYRKVCRGEEHRLVDETTYRTSEKSNLQRIFNFRFHANDRARCSCKVFRIRNLKQTKNNLQLNWDSISTNQACSNETSLTIIRNRRSEYSSTLIHFCSTLGEGAAGMTANRVPGTRAGLKERSQSAYAAPNPKPVDSATGHVRPNKCDMMVSSLNLPGRQ